MIEDLEFIFDQYDEADDIDIINVVEAPRRPKVIRPRTDPMECYDDIEFKKRYRLSKETCQFVHNQIQHELEHPTNQNNAISSMNQLLACLRFYATGTMERVVADMAGISESSVCQIIKRVSWVLARLAPDYIKMPDSPVEIQQTKQEFEAIANFPNVIGAIDCTHIKIISPGGENPEVFRNRKGWFSFNVQTISDAKLKIRDIVTRWPGSVHDRTIFSNCRLKNRLDQGQFGDSLIVADQGYTLTKYMMTPLAQTHNRPEQLYNEALIRTRNVVERQYGVWKARFPVLRLEARLKLETTMAVIVATAVLNNIAQERNEELPANAIILEEDNWLEAAINEEPDGLLVRNFLINEYFANLN